MGAGGAGGPIDCDLLVVGSGAGGLSAAVTAAWHGLEVVVAEKEPVLGGTTAWSGGWTWAPRNPLAQRAGIIEDPEFGRGSTLYNPYQGDARIRHNPNVAPLAPGPFYAVKVVPGSFGTFAGLRTDGSARVLDAAGAPIPGLYAAGTDMASVMGGHYPAGGINIGPALTFGYVAGRHAAGATSCETDDQPARTGARR